MFGYSQVRELIEISALGEVCVLGVRIGMQKNVAIKILTPQHPHLWQLIEFEDKIEIYGHGHDNAVHIYYTTNTISNKITEITISRPLYGDENKRDDTLKYYTKKFSSYKKEEKEQEWQPYKTELNIVKIKIDNLNIFNHKLYGFTIKITRNKVEEYIDSQIAKPTKKNLPGWVYFAKDFLILICIGLLLWNISYITQTLSTKDFYLIASFILLAICITLNIIESYENEYELYISKLKSYINNFANNFDSSTSKYEAHLLASIKQYESQIDKEKKLWLKEQETIYQQKQKQLSDERGILRYEHNNKMQLLSIKEQTYEDVLKGSLFKRSASMYADYKELEINAIETYLMTKKNPIKAGCSTAEELKKLKQSKREDVARYKEMLYKWEYLMNVFPELEDYVDDDELTSTVADYENLEDLQNDYDRAKLYVSKEEYEGMSVNARNQLALDRWWKQPCGVEEAGKRYELYCGYCFEKKGYKVEYHGIKEGKNDLGIDLIATKDGKTLIIQCKRRRQEGKIHHNTVCQLFGSTVWYADRKKLKLFEDVTPVLMTSGKLDETAEKMAKVLSIEVCHKPMGIYPIIKCNINNGNKIYHLPFDQQYNNTIIEPEKGEFYALTVEEATKAEFRRAFRHYIN